MFNITELNPNDLFPRNDRDIFYIGNAYSYGAEVFLQKRYGNLYGWIGYTLGWIEAKFPMINNGQTFNPKYDRRNDLKIVAQYILSDSWEVGGQFTFQTGQPYTGATSISQIDMPGSSLGKDIIVPSQVYGLRLPPSHQLNLNATYNFLSWGLKSKLILDIFNVYDRRDIWFKF